MIAQPFQGLQISESYRLPIILPLHRPGYLPFEINAIDGIHGYLILQRRLPAGTHKQFGMLVEEEQQDAYNKKHTHQYPH